jgi:hypothetical protein
MLPHGRTPGGHRVGDPARFAARLDEEYHIPNPLDSDTEAARYIHTDLEAKTKLEAWQDREALKARLRKDPRPDAWLLQRLWVLTARLRELGDAS